MTESIIVSDAIYEAVFVDKPALERLTDSLRCLWVDSNSLPGKVLCYLHSPQPNEAKNADRMLLKDLQDLVKRYPGKRISFVLTPPLPGQFPISSSFAGAIQAAVLLDPLTAEVWPQQFLPGARPITLIVADYQPSCPAMASEPVLERH